MVQDSASTSNVKDAAALKPSGQVMGCRRSTMVSFRRAQCARLNSWGVEWKCGSDDREGSGAVRVFGGCGLGVGAGTRDVAAVDPRAEDRVDAGAGESAGQPGEVPAAQCHG